MSNVVSIYKAKTQFSNLVKRASAGEMIFIGAHGHPQAMLSPLPSKKTIRIGIWDHKFKSNAYKDADIVGPDADIANGFETSTNQPFPKPKK